MPSETTAVVKPDSGSIKSLLQSDMYKQQFAMVLPKHLTPDRMVRVALTALIRTPGLMKCTPASVMQCLMDCSALGLEPDGRRAHLIPYGDKCTLIVDYKGIAELVMRSGLVSYIHADVVCENDEFEENLGQILKHKIDHRKPRGEAYAAYSYVKMKDGTESCNVMGKHEIEEIRKRFSRSSGNADSPWQTRPYECWKKTVFRQHSKWLPLSPDIRDAVEKDADMVLPEKNVTPDVVAGPATFLQDEVMPDMGQGKPVEPVQTPPEPPAEPPEPEGQQEQPELPVQPPVKQTSTRKKGPLSDPKAE